ncbi:MAG: DUF4124 domain-containing protein [Gammaproteobacteria bacterium]|nr:DUF4124 domain-containing protein [Gammaproteobacteria bacterium]
MTVIRDDHRAFTNPRGFAVLGLALASLIMSSGALAASKIYRTVDEDGNVIFTDVPPRGDQAAKTVELDSFNTYESEGKTTLRSPDGRELWIIEDETDEDGPPVVVNYQFLGITSPENDATIRDNAGNLRIAAKISPELRPGHTLRLLLDGSPQQTSRNPDFYLSNVDRGTHRLAVEVVDELGTVLITSPASVVHMMRHTVLGPKASPRP